MLGTCVFDIVNKLSNCTFIPFTDEENKAVGLLMKLKQSNFRTYALNHYVLLSL